MLGGEERARRRRKKEMLRRLRELDELDAAYGLGASPHTVAPRRTSHRGPRRNGAGTAITVALTAALLAVVVGFGTSGVSRAVRDTLGLGPEPLAEVPLLSTGEGSYEWMMTQPGDGDQPVTYDPCREIQVVVNPDDAPVYWEDLVETATEHVSRASGLQFDIVGETDERPAEDRPTRDPARYGKGYSPVLVSWASADEIDGLDGDVAGLGGSTAVETLGHAVYVTGQITLDEHTFQDLQARPNGKPQAQAIVDHEFGHLVGLGHVDDRGELMAEDNTGRLDWGPGDRAGLSRLGRGKCY